MSSASAQRLIERGPDIAAFTRVMAELTTGGGRSVVVRGHAGLGKSALLAVAAELGRDAGHTVVAARAVGLDADIPFALARKLFAPLVADAATRAQLLEGDGALASTLFDADWVSDPRDDLAYGFREGLCAMVSNAARTARREGSAVVLVLDDVQWADVSSLRFLLALAGRLDQLPVAVIAARRVERIDDQRANLLDALEVDPITRVITLEPLSADAVDDLVAARLGEPARHQLGPACATATGGNPFYLWEMVRDLQGTAAPLPSAAEVAETVPAAVVRSVAVRLAGLPTQAAELATALAVLGDDCELQAAARLAQLLDVEAERAADALAGAAIVRAGEPLCFVHPLVGSAVYDNLPTFERRRAHRRAADLLISEGSDVERAAAHLLLARPQDDPRAAAVLHRAASLALSRGEPEVAVRRLERALAEHPSVPEQAAILVDLAGADSRSGSAKAAERLEQALTLLDDPAAQARTLRAHAAVLQHAGDFDGAAAACRRALELLAPDDPLADQVRAGFIGAAMNWPPLLDEARTVLDHHLEEAARGTLPDVAPLCAQLAIHGAGRGYPDALVRALGLRALADDPLVDGDSFGISLGYAVQSLIWVDELEAATRAADAAADVAMHRGAAMGLAVARVNQATAAYHAGRLDDAVAFSVQALDVVGHEWTDSAWSAPTLALAQLERGDLDAARDAVLLGERASTARSEYAMVLESRARLALARNDPAAALADALQAGAVVEHEFRTTCSRLFRWRTIGALAAHRVGDRAQAERLVDEALEEARQVGTARQLGETLTVAGSVAGGARGLALLDEATTTLAGSPSRLSFAHSLTTFGAALRRHGDRTAARQSLARASELATSFGALPLSARARHELALLGAQPRRRAQAGPEALTAGERAVANLAADGLANAAIAGRLFVTRKTVETHLSSVYRKLGVKGRGELAAVLTAAARPTSQAAAGVSDAGQ